jgi:hypothetical protein
MRKAGREAGAKRKYRGLREGVEMMGKWSELGRKTAARGRRYEKQG